MRAHTSTTQARVRGGGRMTRRIVPGGILALMLAVALLAATASTASAHWLLAFDCAPLPTPGQIPGGGCFEPRYGRGFDFGDRRVGTTSPAQGFAMLVTNGSFEPSDNGFQPRISVSGDYAQTNDCRPSLSVLERCLIAVSFAPTSAGPKKGTLRTGPGGPTATLTGRGVKHWTPPVLPLRLDAFANGLQKLGRSGVVEVGAVANIGHCLIPSCPDYGAKLVLRGDVKKTTRHLATDTNVPTEIKARLEHLRQLKAKPTAPRIKVKFKATDEFGQTATEERQVVLCRRVVNVPHQESPRCVWHPSRK
jgi:hypothetical protein